MGKIGKKIGAQTKCITNYYQSKSPNPVVLAIFAVVSPRIAMLLSAGIDSSPRAPRRNGVETCDIPGAEILGRNSKFVHNYNY